MTIQVKEQRAAERFDTVDEVTGSFGAVEVTVVNVCETGVKVLHSQPLRIGTRGGLRFRRGNVSVATQARVVWSHLSKEPQSGGRLLYQSGLHLDTPDNTFAAAVQMMLQEGMLRRDLESLERKRKRLEQREREKSGQPAMKMMAGPAEPEVTPDQALLIEQARTRLRTSPQETARWAARARTPENEAHGDEALAIWEYLERTIELPKISRFLK